MWDVINYIIIGIEIILLLFFVLGKILKKKYTKSLIYIVLVFIVNLSIHLLLYLQDIDLNNTTHNYFVMILDIIIDSIKLFIGDVKFREIRMILPTGSITFYSYGLGVILAIFGTIFLFIEFFGSKIINYFRVLNRMKKPTCDIVMGKSDDAIKYLESSKNGILLINKKLEKAEYVSLIDKGFGIISSEFNLDMISKKYFNKTTIYNFIAFYEENKFFSYVDSFVKYYENNTDNKNVCLYIEEENSKIETLKKEIIEKQKCESYIKLFSKDDLLVRDFVEKNPVVSKLPRTFIDEDSSIKSDALINVFMIGYNATINKLLKEYIINNQLVSFVDGEYKNHLINYHVYLNNPDNSDYMNESSFSNIFENLSSLDGASNYGIMPDATHNINYYVDEINFNNLINHIKEKISKDNSYTYIFIDVSDDYKNLNVSSKIKQKLIKFNNYHLYVRSSLDFVKDDSNTTYFGDYSKLLNHEVIVNDELSKVARKINEMYFIEYNKDNEELVKNSYVLANKEWDKFDHFLINSNISAALNLRFKLNLLGLDLVFDGLGNNIDLIDEVYKIKDIKSFDEYLTKSKKNAQLATEHARWNAYHLLNDYTLINYDDIKVKEIKSDMVKFTIKNTTTLEHACLTTFKGLTNLSKYLKEKASTILGKEVDILHYDYYKSDEFLLKNLKQILRELKISLIYKK